jgi:hypothetical protein
LATVNAGETPLAEYQRRELSESDWKVFRKLHALALDRFCQRILADVRRLTSDTSESHHKRYLDLYEFVKRKDRELAEMFDNPRRSVAFEQMALIWSKNLVTEEEMSGFSLRAREVVDFFAGRT